MSKAEKRQEVILGIISIPVFAFVGALFMFSFSADSQEEQQKTLLSISAPSAR
jgi:hypothetical protein